MKKELTEYEIILHTPYDVELASALHTATLLYQSNSQNIDSFMLINLSLLKEQVDAQIKKLLVIQRFYKLNKSFNDELHCNSDGFYIDGHKFSTLDEVEKVWKNKAFL